MFKTCSVGGEIRGEKKAAKPKFSRRNLIVLWSTIIKGPQKLRSASHSKTQQNREVDMATSAMRQNTWPARKTVSASSAILPVQRQSIAFLIFNENIFKNWFLFMLVLILWKDILTQVKRKIATDKESMHHVWTSSCKEKKRKKFPTSCQRGKIICKTPKTLTAALEESVTSILPILYLQVGNW